MVVTILIVWFFLTFPIMYEVNKKLKGTPNEWVTNSIVFQLMLLWKTFWNAPQYYILIVKELFTKKKK